MKRANNFFWKFIATTGGAGLSPFAPGTMGALVGVLLLWGLDKQANFNYVTAHWIFLLLILLATLLGVKAANEVEKEWGHDAQRIVIDELVGVWIAILFFPVNWMTLLLAFVLFRFFDIAKPLGIRKMEQFKGGWGVMLDDVLAGVYAWMTLKGIAYFFPEIAGYPLHF